MKNRIFCIALCVIFCMALCSVGVSAKDKTLVTEVDVYIGEPVLGQPLDYDIFLFGTPEDTVYFDPNREAFQWYRMTKEMYATDRRGYGEVCHKGDIALDGYVYVLDVYVNVEDTANYEMSPTVKGYINDRPHDDRDFGCYCDEDEAYLTYGFVPATVVDSIAATITEPVKGAKPDTKPAFTSTPKNAVEHFNISWYRLAASDYTGSSGDRWEYMNSDETFETGYYYVVDMSFIPKDTFGFTEALTGTVNGKPSDETYGVPFEAYNYARLSIIFEPIQIKYAITDGNNQALTVNSGDSLTITCEGEYGKFIAIEVDGEEVNQKNYTSKSGSTIVTLKPDYIKSLETGEHSIQFVYVDGRSEMGSFTIVPKVISPDPSSKGKTSPKTGDNTVAFMMFGLACAAVVLGRKKHN